MCVSTSTRATSPTHNSWDRSSPSAGAKSRRARSSRRNWLSLRTHFATTSADSVRTLIARDYP